MHLKQQPKMGLGPLPPCGGAVQESSRLLALVWSSTASVAMRQANHGMEDLVSSLSHCLSREQILKKGKDPRLREHSSGGSSAGSASPTKLRAEFTSPYLSSTWTCFTGLRAYCCRLQGPSTQLVLFSGLTPDLVKTSHKGHQPLPRLAFLP